jgi:hypothetical protein
VQRLRRRSNNLRSRRRILLKEELEAYRLSVVAGGNADWALVVGAEEMQFVGRSYWEDVVTGWGMAGPAAGTDLQVERRIAVVVQTHAYHDVGRTAALFAGTRHRRRIVVGHTGPHSQCRSSRQLEGLTVPQSGCWGTSSKRGAGS